VLGLDLLSFYQAWSSLLHTWHDYCHVTGDGWI